MFSIGVPLIDQPPHRENAYICDLATGRAVFTLAQFQCAFPPLINNHVNPS